MMVYFVKCLDLKLIGVLFLGVFNEINWNIIENILGFYWEYNRSLFGVYIGCVFGGYKL